MGRFKKFKEFKEFKHPLTSYISPKASVFKTSYIFLLRMKSRVIRQSVKNRARGGRFHGLFLLRRLL